MGQIKKVAGLSVLLASLFVLFQNCGQAGFKSEDGSLLSLGSASCDLILKETYAKTYFPLLKTSCNLCHSSAHGSTDLSISFTAFKAKGATLIDYKATHPHGDNGLDLSAQINALKAPWEAGQAEYMTCLSSLGSGDEQLGYRLRLDAKTIPDLAMTLTNQTQWKVVEWDLDAENIENKNYQFNALLKIEARYYLQGGLVAGIEFRNPSMKLKSTGRRVQVKGLNIYLENKLQSNVTTYENVAAVISDITDTALAPGGANAFAYFPEAQANTLFAIEIQNIKFADSAEAPIPGGPTPPAPGAAAVTFTQLVSTDATLGVFRSRCLSCHSGLQAAKALDLTNYTQSKNAASLIQSRMNSTTAPMPPSGLLPQSERDVVGRWINGGAPQ